VTLPSFGLSGSLGDGCSTDEDCSAVVDHSRCDDVTMTCQCDVIAGYRQLDDGACDIRKLIFSLNSTDRTRSHLLAAYYMALYSFIST